MRPSLLCGHTSITQRGVLVREMKVTPQLVPVLWSRDYEKSLEKGSTFEVLRCFFESMAVSKKLPNPPLTGHVT